MRVGDLCVADEDGEGWGAGGGAELLLVMGPPSAAVSVLLLVADADAPADPAAPVAAAAIGGACEAGLGTGASEDRSSRSCVIRSELLSMRTTWSALSQARTPPGLIQVASVGQLQLSLGTTWACLFMKRRPGHGQGLVKPLVMEGMR
jgi:hypothetical protein